MSEAERYVVSSIAPMSMLWMTSEAADGMLNQSSCAFSLSLSVENYAPSPAVAVKVAASARAH